MGLAIPCQENNESDPNSRGHYKGTIGTVSPKEPAAQTLLLGQSHSQIVGIDHTQSGWVPPGYACFLGIVLMPSLNGTSF